MPLRPFPRSSGRRSCWMSRAFLTRRSRKCSAFRSARSCRACTEGGNSCSSGSTRSPVSVGSARSAAPRSERSEGLRMDCDDCLERLYTFLDQELGPTERKEVAQHLADCGDCDDNFVFEERFLRVIRDCGTSDIAPAELRQRVVERLRRDAPPSTI